MAARVIKSAPGTVHEFASPWNRPLQAPVPAMAKPNGAAPPPPPSPALDEVPKAYQRGRQEGEAAVREAAERVLNTQLAEIAASAAAMAELRPAIIRTAQKDVLHLAIAIARRILHREMSMSEDALEGIIAVTLDKLEGQEVSRLRVHPSMVAGVEATLYARGKNCRAQVVGDASLKPGGCVFETARGNVDAGLESQLMEIEQGLADHLEASH